MSAKKYFLVLSLIVITTICGTTEAKSTSNTLQDIVSVPNLKMQNNGTYVAAVSKGNLHIVNKTREDVFISSEAGCKCDVLFLIDTTGSMSGPISDFKTALSGILTAIDACSPCPDIMYGVADYRDYTDGGNYQTYGVNLIQPFTSDTDVVQSAINGLSSGGGDDWPESQLKSILNISENWLTTIGDLGFKGRADAKKFLIWAGDAPGHIAGDEPGSSGPPPSGYYPTLDAVVNALAAQGIVVFALNAYDCNDGLNIPYGGIYNQTNLCHQADEITSATSGILFCNAGSGGPSIENAIVAAMTCGHGYLTLTKLDDVNDGDCVIPGREITYTIDYNYPYEPNLPDINDVNIVDYLPAEVGFVSASGPNCVQPDSNTVIWHIGTLHPGDSGSVTLKVNVKYPGPGSIITNKCELRNGDDPCDTAYEYTPVCCWEDTSVIYVDAGANGYKNGTSWENAYNYLQDALTAAHNCDCNEILVAQGIYKPDVSSAYPNETGNREATFQLLDGVAIYGGFPSGGGTWQDRKPTAYQTILSGDLLGNDRQVAEPYDLLSDPCRADNSFHVVSGIRTTQTTVLDGFTITAGNANGGSPYNSGGGMYNNYIWNGSVYYGGNPTVRNCIFRQNSAQYVGGGIYSNIYYDSNTTITNCIFIENSAQSGGGILIGEYGDVNITNCTIVANGADSGGGIYLYSSGCPGCAASVTVTNCILWGNDGGQISGYTGYTINVTYSDIQGGWAGVGNIEDYPMFGADGWHLKMCSPCVDAGTNTPAGGLPATDIDGQARIMSGQCAGTAVVDMGADEYFPDCNAMLYAHCQKPACNAIAALYVGGDPNINLTWCPGLLAADVNGQDVYFGTSYSDVDNATTATPITYKGRRSDPNYLATGLVAGATYYWRIDEVNDANIWRGPVYSFRTGLFIDDFERYNSTADLNANWPNGYTLTGCTNCDVGCNSKGYAGLVLIRDATGKYLQYTYNNNAQMQPGYGGTPMAFSEAKHSYSLPGVSFTGGGVISPEPNTLRIDYKGTATNTANMPNIVNADDTCDMDRMYVAIEDAEGNVGVYLNPDPYAQRATNWTPWPIALKDINALGVPNPVNLNAITGFAIGFGERCLSRDNGSDAVDANSIVMFDNIRLEPPPAMPGCGLVADFTGDCFVNFKDFAVMGEEWHRCGQADFNQDCIVDLMDLEVLAEEWLK
jgi:hypothetical protein